MKKYQKTNPIIIAATALAFLSIMFGYVFAKEIRSTKEGGNWCQRSTWIGDEIPCVNDNVIIDGKVTVNCPALADSVYINLDCLLVVSEKDSLLCQYIKIQEEYDMKGAIENHGIINVEDKPEIKNVEELKKY